MMLSGQSRRVGGLGVSDMFLKVVSYPFLGLVALYLVARVVSAAYFKSKQQFEGTNK